MSGFSDCIKRADLRVNLLLLAASTAAISVCRSEQCFAALLLASVLWLLMCGRIKKGFLFIAAYVILFGISRLTIGKEAWTTIWLFSAIARHMLIPIAFISDIMDRPTGSFLAVFSKLHIPKGMGIATVVLLRFFPAIRNEFHAIRSALKFRGIGVTVWNVLVHPLKTFEYILIPMLIRTTRIAEELSAAAIVRGVRLDNDIISFEPISFSWKDVGIASAFGMIMVLICLADVFLFCGANI